MRHIRYHNRAFTLLELMIAIALMLIVMLMLRSMFVNAQELYMQAARRVEVYTQARAALDLIEQDMLRIVKDEGAQPLAVRSLTPADWARPDSVRTSDIYSNLTTWDRPDPNETVKVRDFLSFPSTVTWQDDERNDHTDQCVVTYFLRRRPAGAQTDQDGAYLVRRVIPQFTLADVFAVARGGKPRPMQVTEDELASFVYAVRVYVDDQSAFRYGAHTRNFRLDIMPEASKSHPNGKWLWVDTSALGQQSAQPGGTGALQPLPLPNDYDRAEFGGIWTGMTSAPVSSGQPGGGQSRGFTTGRWNYPSVVMVEITVIDRQFSRYDSESGDGTYRTFSRAMQLPVSDPLMQLDDEDLSILGR